jgi:hypothetical protein
MFLCGLSTFYTDFPNDNLLINAIQEGKAVKYTPAFWANFVLFLYMQVKCSRYQKNHLKDHDDLKQVNYYDIISLED